MPFVRHQAAGSGHYGSGGFGAQTATFASEVLSNALLVCFWWGNSNVGSATCADNVNGAWTALTQQTPVAGSGRRMNWFYKLNSAPAAAGAMTVTVSPNANAGNTESMMIIEYTPARVLDTNITASGVHASGTTATQTTGTPTQANDLILMGFAADTEGVHTFTANSPMTAIVADDTDGKTGGSTNGSATMAVAEYLAAGSSFVTGSMGIGISDDGGKYIIGFAPPATPSPNTGRFFPFVIDGVG